MQPEEQVELLDPSRVDEVWELDLRTDRNRLSNKEKVLDDTIAEPQKD